MEKESFNKKFDRFTTIVEHAVGSPWAFVSSVVVVVIWGAFGPFYNYSDTWQLIANTGTTIITFWLAFIIQATQTKSTIAIQLKLDELLYAIKEARTDLVNIESKSAQEITEEKEALARLAKE